MVTKTMEATSTEQLPQGSWSKLFGRQRRRTYQSSYGRIATYESKASGFESTYKKQSRPKSYASAVEDDDSYRANSYKSIRYGSGNQYTFGREGTASYVKTRSASVDRDVERSVLNSESYFHRTLPGATRREYEDDVENLDVLSRVRRKLELRKQRSQSVDRMVGDYETPFWVAKTEKHTDVIRRQKERASLRDRAEEIYQNRYSSSSPSSSSRYQSYSRYANDNDDAPYTGIDYRTMLDGIPNKYRTRGYSEDRQVNTSSLYSARGSSASTRSVRFAEDQDYEVNVPRRRAASVSRYNNYDYDYNNRNRITKEEVSAQYGEVGRLAEFESKRKRGSDISCLVMDPNTDFVPDRVRTVTMPSGRSSTEYVSQSQTGHGDKYEQNAELEKVIQKTQLMQKNMYTLEDFVRQHRYLFPEDTQVQQDIKFFQLNEKELADIGEAPDAVVYGVKIKERLLVPEGCDITDALNKYYSNKGSAKVEVDERREIRRRAEYEEETHNQTIQDAIRKKVEKEFEQRDKDRILGDRRIELKVADRAVERRDRYNHVNADVNSSYMRSVYKNAGLDYDSIYEISRSRRSSMGSMSDVESIATRTSLGSTASSRRRNRMDSAPNFTAKLRPKKCHEGQTVRFNASCSAMPMPDVSWFKGNRLITEGGRFHTSNNYGLLSLEISKVKRDDAGIYTVKAHNIEGEAACSAALEVTEIETYIEKKDGTKKPWFVVEAQNTWAEVGGRATLEAQATGAPVPTFKWQRDNISLQESERVKVFTDEIGNVKVVIKGITHADAGLYFCIAENRAGKAKCAATLRVVDKGQLADRRRSASREPTPQRSRRGSMSRDTTPLAVHPLPERRVAGGNEPWFLQKPPATMNVHEGEVLTLKAVVDGDPKPKVTWLKEPHRELSYSQRHRVVVNGDKHMMEITSAVATDAGRFICMAENEHGRAGVATFVNMLPPRDIDDDDLEVRAQMIQLPEYEFDVNYDKEKGKMAPMFTKRLPVSKEVTEGDTLQVECKVDDAETEEVVTDVDVKLSRVKEGSIKTVTIGKGGHVTSVEETSFGGVTKTTTTTTTTKEIKVSEQQITEEKSQQVSAVQTKADPPKEKTPKVEAAPKVEEPPKKEETPKVEEAPKAKEAPKVEEDDKEKTPVPETPAEVPSLEVTPPSKDCSPQSSADEDSPAPATVPATVAAAPKEEKKEPEVPTVKQEAPTPVVVEAAPKEEKKEEVAVAATPVKEEQPAKVVEEAKAPAAAATKEAPAAAAAKEESESESESESSSSESDSESSTATEGSSSESSTEQESD